jgi:N-acetylglucosaminyl-diphospho-decaprenol L-rhamnosyltransferase
MASAVRLSVIVVNWNVRDLVRKCLRSLQSALLVPTAEYEIIVVDNASADGSVEMLRAEFPEIRLIASPVNLGFGAGCNLAYKACRGEFVLLLNPDTEVREHAVDDLLGLMAARPRAGIVAPRLANEDGSFQPAAGGALPTLANVAWNYLFLKDVLPRAIAPAALFLDSDPREVIAIGWVSGASMLLRREAVGESIFDEAFFMFGEDMDVCDRVRRGGWEVLYAGGISILHHHGKSFDQQESIEIRANAHDGPRRVFRKTHGAVSAAVYDLIMFKGFLIRWPLYALLAQIRPASDYAARSRYARSYLTSMLGRRRKERIRAPASPP